MRLWVQVPGRRPGLARPAQRRRRAFHPHQPTATPRSSIWNSGNLLQAQRLRIAETSYASFAALASGGGTSGPGNASQVVLYTFTYTQPYLTPIAVVITGSQQVVHTLRLVVQNEPFPES
jgi:hypothetical protein